MIFNGDTRNFYRRIEGTFIPDDSMRRLGIFKHDNLEDTIKDIREEQCYDDRFNKYPRFLHPVKTPPFYAAGFSPGGYGTVGGIKINEKIEVLTGARHIRRYE